MQREAFEPSPSMYSAHANDDFISEGVHAIMETGRSAMHSQQDFEPTRRVLLANPAPPKRFYRTFWRSVARRVVAREMEATVMLRQKQPS